MEQLPARHVLHLHGGTQDLYSEVDEIVIFYHFKLFFCRILLGLYSNLINGLLSTPGLGDLPGISVPASSGCLVNLLKILSTGVAIANNKSHLLEAT